MAGQLQLTVKKCVLLDCNQISSWRSLISCVDPSADSGLAPEKGSDVMQSFAKIQ